MRIYDVFVCIYMNGIYVHICRIYVGYSYYEFGYNINRVV